jgi:hypothetical protein
MIAGLSTISFRRDGFFKYVGATEKSFNPVETVGTIAGFTVWRGILVIGRLWLSYKPALNAGFGPTFLLRRGFPVLGIRPKQTCAARRRISSMSVKRAFSWSGSF